MAARPHALIQAQRYIPPSRRGECSECGGTVAVVARSAEAERRRCRKCQRANPKTYMKQPTGLVRCWCGKVFEQRVSTQKYCCPEHRPKPAVVPRRSTTERGYGAEHRKERERRLAIYRPGDICAHGGEPLQYWPIDLARQYLDLPHNAARTGYLPGLACRKHNRQDGAIRGNRQRGLRVVQLPQQPWQPSRQW